MTVENVSTLIQTVGFPIVMVIACVWYIKYREDRHTTERDSLNKAHSEQIANMLTVQQEQFKQVVSAINNNTQAMTVLSENLKVNA